MNHAGVGSFEEGLVYLVVSERLPAQHGPSFRIAAAALRTSTSR
jgi:hypothetical protein